MIINSIIIILETANQFNLLNLLKYLQPLHFGKPIVAKAMGYIWPVMILNLLCPF